MDQQQQPSNQAAIQQASITYQLQQQKFITINPYQQFTPFPLLYGVPIPNVYAPMNVPQWTNLMPNMAIATLTKDEQQKQIEDGLSKLRAFNIIDSNFERNWEKFNLNGSSTTVVMPAFNKSRRLELIEAKKPVAVYKPFILKRWTREDYTRHKELREKHENEKNLELNNAAEKEIKLENRRITVQALKADILKKYMKPYQTTDRWFVVVDTKVLLDDMWFVEKLAMSDPLCRVKVPYETLHDLSQMTMKFRPAWMRAPARRVVQLLEKKSGPLKIFNQQGVIENEDLIDNSLATDAVLNCCMQIMRHYYFVVLVTDDEERRKQAETIDLPSFSFAVLKDMVTLSYTNLHYGHITVTRQF